MYNHSFISISFLSLSITLLHSDKIVPGILVQIRSKLSWGSGWSASFIMHAIILGSSQCSLHKTRHNCLKSSLKEYSHIFNAFHFNFQTNYHEVASSRLSWLVAHFQAVYKGEFWCLCTVTFGQNGPKLNSRPVYCSRLYVSNKV